MNPKRSIVIALMFCSASVFAAPAAVDCGGARDKKFNKRSDMERAWLQISENCFAATADPEVRQIEGAYDPNAWLATEGGDLVLLGSTIRSGTTAKAFQMEAQGEKVGATLVVYWIALDDGRVAAPEQGQRELSVVGDTITLSGQKGGGWALGSGSMKTTTGQVQALYLRDCTKAACPVEEPRPALGDLRICEMPRCAVPPPPHQRWYHRIDERQFAPTEEAAVERIDGAQFDALVDQRFPSAIALGNTVLGWSGNNVEGIKAQALRVGATHALWWIEEPRPGWKREFAVFIRDCSVAACKAP